MIMTHLMFKEFAYLVGRYFKSKIIIYFDSFDCLRIKHICFFIFVGVLVLPNGIFSSAESLRNLMYFLVMVKPFLKCWVEPISALRRCLCVEGNGYCECAFVYARCVRVCVKALVLVERA